jgi:hypothetical protein
MRPLLVLLFLTLVHQSAPAKGLRFLIDSLSIQSERLEVQRDSLQYVATSLDIRLDTLEQRALKSAAAERRLMVRLDDATTRTTQLEDLNHTLLVVIAVLAPLFLFSIVLLLFRRFNRTQGPALTTDADHQVDRLHKLVRLRESGILSAEETEALKQDLMNKGQE